MLQDYYLIDWDRFADNAEATYGDIRPIFSAAGTPQA